MTNRSRNRSARRRCARQAGSRPRPLTAIQRAETRSDTNILLQFEDIVRYVRHSHGTRALSSFRNTDKKPQLIIIENETNAYFSYISISNHHFNRRVDCARSNPPSTPIEHSVTIPNTPCPRSQTAQDPTLSSPSPRIDGFARYKSDRVLATAIAHLLDIIDLSRPAAHGAACKTPIETADILLQSLIRDLLENPCPRAPDQIHAATD